MPISELRERIANLSDREKLMALILAGVLGLTLAVVSFVLVSRKTGGLEATIESNQGILAQLAAKKDELKDLSLRRMQEEARFEKNPPQLLGFLEKLAGETGIEIPESRDLPDEIINKKWVNKSAEIRLKKIGLDTLVKLMVKIKNENQTFPIAITKLNVKRRSGENNSFDIQMTVSSYTKLTKSAKPDPKGTEGTGKGKAKEKPKGATPPKPAGAAGPGGAATATPTIGPQAM